MSKKRTRKNKENTHYPFLISWEKSNNPKAHEAHVNRESKNEKFEIRAESSKAEKAVKTAKDGEGVIFKKSVLKSLIFAGVILILELVIYLALNRFK